LIAERGYPAGVGVLIAVEGLDGAGKHTLVTGLVNRWATQGYRVQTLTFPRYSESVTADIAAEALHGEHGDLRSSVHAMAILFALDRRDAADHLRKLLAANDAVILDRYVASNAAYSAARLGQDADGEVVQWVTTLEFSRFGLPVPDHHLLLDVPTDVAIGRATSRAELDASRLRDHYERDHELQERTGLVYRALAEMGWMSPWSRLGTEADPELADRLIAI
jgi:dTMP kinase